MKPQKLNYSRGYSYSSRPYSSQVFKKSSYKNSNSKDKLPYINPNFNPLLNSYKNSKKFKVQRPFWEKEKLNDRCLKLEDDIKRLNEKYKIVEKENKKQKKEILEQNKELNKYKNLNFNNENKEEEEEEKNNFNYYINDNNNNEIKKTLLIFNKEEEEDENNSLKNKTYKNKYKKDESISYTFTKTEENEDEEDQYLTKSEIHEKKKIKFEKKMKLIGETTISNLRLLSRELNNENSIKKNEINNLNKNSKIAKINDILREKDMLENEIKNLKNKLQFASDKLTFYENMEKNYEDLKNQVKSKDNQIKILIVKNEQTVDDNEKEIIEMENVIANKDKEIAELEKKILKNKLKKQKDHFLKKHLKKPKTKKTEKKENIENKNNENNENNKENENLEEEIDLKLKYPELYQIYIEMKKKGLNSSNAFVYGVLAPLNDITPLPKNKIIYSGGISQLLQIDNKDDKIFCINLANKLLIPNKKLNEMKNEQTQIMNNFFNKKINYLDINEFEDRIYKINKDFMQKVFEKYDKNYDNFISFDNMLKAIKELDLNDIEEDVLLFCKDIKVFNKMNYWDLVNLIDEEKQKKMEEEKKKKEEEDRQIEEEEKKKKEEEERQREEEEKKKKEEEERQREEEEKKKKEEEERQREEEEKKKKEEEEEKNKKEEEEFYIEKEEEEDKKIFKDEENNLESKLKILVTYLKDNDTLTNLFEECIKNSEEEQNNLLDLEKLYLYLERNCKVTLDDTEKEELYNKFENPYYYADDKKCIDSKKFEEYLTQQIQNQKLNDDNYDPYTQVKNDVGIEGLDD